jgi:hypothetical protein
MADRGVPASRSASPGDSVTGAAEVPKLPPMSWLGDCLTCAGRASQLITILSPAGEVVREFVICDGCYGRVMAALKSQSKWERHKVVIAPQLPL